MKIHIADATVLLIEGLLRPLKASGAIHPTEVNAIIELLRQTAKGECIPQEKSRKLLTREQAAERLAVCPKTISRMIAAGELEAKYLRKGSPRTLRITSKSLERLEAVHCDGGRRHEP